MLKKRTKIVCTIGPASAEKETLKKMIEAGMDVARINFSHNTHENNGALIEAVRAAAQELDKPVALLADLQGPRIRVGELPPEGLKFEKGDTIMLDASLERYKNSAVPVTYPGLAADVQQGQRILIEDGRFEVAVKSVKGSVIEGTVAHGGVLLSNKGINLPDTSVSLRALTSKDKEDLQFIVQKGVDFVGLSFVRDAQEVLDLRYLIKDLQNRSGQGEPEIKIISKIEKHEAVKHIDEIISATDAVMVARGDLGVELAAEEVPIWQKRIIDKCLAASKPVIVATQMLENMMHHTRPTRAEVSDVANAVIDHADAVMLSGETANGEYPVLAVGTMNKIALRTEASIYDDLKIERPPRKNEPLDETMSQLARILADRIQAQAILAASLTGESGRRISAQRPELHIFVATGSPRVARQLNLCWGVRPFILPECKSVEELVDRSLTYLRKAKEVKTGETIIIVAGEPVGQAGNMNLVEVRKVA